MRWVPVCLEETESVVVDGEEVRSNWSHSACVCVCVYVCAYRVCVCVCVCV